MPKTYLSGSMFLSGAVRPSTVHRFHMAIFSGPVIA